MARTSPHKDTCESCDKEVAIAYAQFGNGMTLDICVCGGKRHVRCPKCVGSGTVMIPLGQYTVVIPGVLGIVPNMKERSCPDCNGTGEQELP